MQESIWNLHQRGFKAQRGSKELIAQAQRVCLALVAIELELEES